MTFEEAETTLYSLIDYEKKRTAAFYGPPYYDLGAFRAFLGELGDPHEKVPFPILVAGTKGKGSTAAILASVFREAGYRTGLFTSPHLRTVLERFRVDGEPMREEEFTGFIEELWPLVEARRTAGYRTVFEVLTAIAFLHFIRSGVDVSIFEVGVGGRLDATNVVEPQLSLITSISLDHTDLLGATLDSIAREKAGIMRSGRLVVSSPQDPAARAMIETISAQIGAPLELVGRDIEYRLEEQSLEGQRFGVIDQQGRRHELSLPLLGRFQLENACLAFSALDAVRRNGLPIDDDALRRGFARVRWPGRFHLVSQRPYLVLDGAHNPASVRALCRAVEELVPSERRILIMGIMNNKDVEGVLDEFAPCITTLIATRAQTPRALDPSELAALARMRISDVETAGNARAALARARELAGEEDLILVAGSLYLAGNMLEILEKEGK
jgi:dihydrofolate synthase/folylpolyglutamate synthase